MVMNRSGIVNMTDAFLFLTIMLVASIVVTSASQSYQPGHYTHPDAARTLNVLMHSTVSKITMHSSSGTITLKNWTRSDILALYAVQSQKDREDSSPAVEESMKSVLDSIVMQSWHYELFLKADSNSIVLLKVSGGTYGSHDSIYAHSTYLSNGYYVQLIIE